MLKKLIVLFILIIGIAQAIDIPPEFEYLTFTQEQKRVLKESYYFGLPFDMEYTLAAIAWQESSAGKYLVNLNDPSAGAYHIFIPSVMARHSEIPNTSLNRNKMAQKLIDNIDFAASEALAELEYWQTIHGKGNWMLIWQSYNGGFSYRSPETLAYKKSYNYANSIKRKVKYLINYEIFVKKPDSGWIKFKTIKYYEDKTRT